MGTFRLPHFSSPATLRAVDRGWLLAFFLPHRRFLYDRGVALPLPAGPAPVPFDDLVRVLMSPDGDTPRDLIDALHYVDGMATPEGMHALIAAARAAGVELDGGDDVTPAEVAVQLWLRAPGLVERAHAEQYLNNPRTFEYFQAAADPAPEAPAPGPAVVAALERELDDWFADHRRGRAARVFRFDRPDGAWFLVRHGEPFKREESVRAGEPASVAYRPLRYDVVAYDPACGELRVHAQLKGEKDLYRRAFGRHLFAADEAFPGTDKYTLAPLRAGGPAALACDDVDGIDRVTLREVQFYFGGSPWEVVTRKSDDLFRLFGTRAAPFPEAGKLIRAAFQVKFADSRRTRTVVIRPPNVAQFTRDADAALVERWLAARGFLSGGAGDARVPVGAVLAGG